MSEFEECRRNPYSVEVEIDASKVSGTQQNIPLMVEIPNSSNSFLNVVAFGDKGKQLATEIEGVANDKNWIHTTDDVQSVFNQHMKVFYGGTGGKSAANSTYGSQAVWGSNYVGVWHMNDTDAFKNSVNDDGGTVYNSPALGDGKYGKKISFISTSSQYIDVGDIDTSDTTLTYIASIDDTTPTSKQGIITKFHPIPGGGSWLNWIGTDGKIRAIAADGGNRSVYSKVLSDGVEHIHTFSSEDGGNVTFKTDFDSIISGDAVTNMQQNATTMLIGAYRSNDAPGTPTEFLDGDISEVRLSNIVRSENYQTTTHKNLNNPTATGTDAFYLSITKEQNYSTTLKSFGRAG